MHTKRNNITGEINHVFTSPKFENKLKNAFPYPLDRLCLPMPFGFSAIVVRGASRKGGP